MLNSKQFNCWLKFNSNILNYKSAAMSRGVKPHASYYQKLLKRPQHYDVVFLLFVTRLK